MTLANAMLDARPRAKEKREAKTSFPKRMATLQKEGRLA
jgi:hypothetical protein